MVLGGDNLEHREPFGSFVKEYLQTGKNIILTTISVGDEIYPCFSATVLVWITQTPKPLWRLLIQLSWFLAKLFVLSKSHLTLSPYLSIAGEKELSRLQQKVQETTEDFKEVVDYFQYTGEGEEVIVLLSYPDPTLFDRVLSRTTFCCFRHNGVKIFFFKVTPPLFFGIWGNFLEVFKNFWKVWNFIFSCIVSFVHVFVEYFTKYFYGHLHCFVSPPRAIEPIRPLHCLQYWYCYLHYFAPSLIRTDLIKRCSFIK